MNPRANQSRRSVQRQLRGRFDESSLSSLSAIEPSPREEIFAYLKLNTPTACPPLTAFRGQSAGNSRPI
jgi:hypothetical protein